MADHVVDEHLDAPVVLEHHVARACARCDLVDENTRGSVQQLVEAVGADRSGRHEDTIDLVLEERLNRASHCLGALTGVDQDQPVGVLLEYGLGALGDRGVEAMRDRRHNETDRVRLAGPERAGGRRRPVVERLGSAHDRFPSRLGQLSDAI